MMANIAPNPQFLTFISKVYKKHYKTPQPHSLFKTGFSALSWLCLAGFLSSCSLLPKATPPEGTGISSADTDINIVYKPFPPETLYSLLVAEMAASRGQPELMLRNYLAQAHQTRDIGITRRATLIAQYLGAHEAALETAQLWESLAPEADEPKQVIAAQLTQQQQLLEAFDYARHLPLTQNNNLLQSIAAQAVNKSDSYKQELLQHYQQALQNSPNNDQLLMGTALLQHFLGEDDQALLSANKSIKSNKDNLAAHLLKASLLEKSGQQSAAAKVLEQQVKNYPDNKRLRLRYARTLTEIDLPAAQEQFQAMVNETPFDGDLLLSLALISKEINDYNTAREYLEQLLFLNKHSSSAYYYLGQISEAEGETAKAAEQYRRVSEGEEYLYAAAAYCRLQLQATQYDSCHQHLQHERQRLPQVGSRLYLIEADSLQSMDFYLESLDLLNQALQDFPDNKDLLYARSAALEFSGNYAAAEADLRTILALEADHPNALNALGYILTNRTDRHREAYELITRAVAMDPQNAAFIDSLGWVLYRLNRTEEALVQLQVAMEKFPNHEIAAHLGEVLWVLDRKPEARKIWKRGLKDKPDSRIIQETMQRLQAN